MTAGGLPSYRREETMTTTMLAFTMGALVGGSISFMALALIIADRDDTSF